MDKVKHAVCRERYHNNPERRPETRNCNRKKDCANERLKNKYVRGCSHDCEQGIVRRNDNGHSWIEGSITIQAQRGGKQSHCKCKKRSDK